MSSLRIKNPTTNKWWNHAFGWVERYSHATLYPDGTPRDMQLPAGGVWYLAEKKVVGSQTKEEWVGS